MSEALLKLFSTTTTCDDTSTAGSTVASRSTTVGDTALASGDAVEEACMQVVDCELNFIISCDLRIEEGVLYSNMQQND